MCRKKWQWIYLNIVYVIMLNIKKVKILIVALQQTDGVNGSLLNKIKLKGVSGAHSALWWEVRKIVARFDNDKYTNMILYTAVIQYCCKKWLCSPGPQMGNP